ncbi:MAG: PIG-L deacetylase family protein [Alphaproteobacteria bacterium]
MTQRSIAVVAAHPDDEVLGFGGAIARHTDAGDRVCVLILATGLAARGDADHQALQQLRDQAQAAAKILGVQQLTFAGLPDNRMDTVPLLDVVKQVEDFLEDSAATVVYTHDHRDLNIDHAICARAVLTACRPLPGATVTHLYAGEILSSSEYADPADRFSPTSYLDIGDQLERKCAALACYTGELRDWPHPRSLQAVRVLAQKRGGEAGLAAAEAFRLIREIR